MRHKFFVFFVLLISATMIVSCSPKEKQVLRIGMNVEFPPFASIVDGAFVGVDVDLAHKIAEKLDSPYEIINMEFDTLIHALISEKVDLVISAMSVTEERSRQIEFTRPYYIAHQVLIGSPKSPPMPTIETEIGKFKLGVLHGSTAHKYIMENIIDKDLMPKDKLMFYVTNTEAIEDLVNGNIDFVINDSSAAYGFSRIYPLTIGLKLNAVEEYAIGMPRAGRLNQAVNEALKDIVNSGEMASIISTHIN